jgi:hypothetical protein
MIKYLAVSLALVLSAASAQILRPGPRPATSHLVKVGLAERTQQLLSQIQARGLP